LPGWPGKTKKVHAVAVVVCAMNPTYRRVYHFHVRKTAGTSLNAAFWALGGIEPSAMRPSVEVVTGNGLRFVRGNHNLIANGDYLFASTHWQKCHVQIPPDTFTVTILRDPVSRVLSYLRYLQWIMATAESESDDPFATDVRAESRFLTGGLDYALGRFSLDRLRAESAIQTLGLRQFLTRLPWLFTGADDIKGFLRRVPPYRLLTQLHMFSKRMDPTEAAENVLACNAVCFSETFSKDLKRIGTTLDLPLEERHERRSGKKSTFTTDELVPLRERLEPEYLMIEQVRRGLATSQSDGDGVSRR
jgi:hypothetical protein